MVRDDSKRLRDSSICVCVRYEAVNCLYNDFVGSCLLVPSLERNNCVIAKPYNCKKYTITATSHDVYNTYIYLQ